MRVADIETRDFIIKDREISFFLKIDPLDESQEELWRILINAALSNDRVRLEVQDGPNKATIISDWKVVQTSDCIFKVRTQI